MNDGVRQARGNEVFFCFPAQEPGRADADAERQNDCLFKFNAAVRPSLHSLHGSSAAFGQRLKQHNHCPSEQSYRHVRFSGPIANWSITENDTNPT